MTSAQNYNIQKHFLKLEIKEFLIHCVMILYKALRSRILFYLLTSYLHSTFTGCPKYKIQECGRGRREGEALVPYIDFTIDDTKSPPKHAYLLKHQGEAEACE